MWLTTYLYQNNEEGNDTLCRFSENKHYFLELVFVGGDDNGFVDKMLAKADEIIFRARGIKARANQIIDVEMIEKDEEINRKEAEAEKLTKEGKLTKEDELKKDEILKKVGELSKSAGRRYAAAMEMIANADGELSVARKINDCYKNKDWNNLRAINNECLEKIKEFDALSGDVSIEQFDQKVTISINRFNKLLIAARTIDNCLKYKELSGFVTVGRGDVECKVISPVFESASGCKINLRMYPNGRGKEQGRSLSVFF